MKLSSGAPPATRTAAATGRRSSARIACIVLVASTIAIAGCSRVAIPKVPMPSLPRLGGNEEVEASSATPRDLLRAKLANPRLNPDTPPLTVGKMIELADRYLACDCARTRFVRSWEKTGEGYRLRTNSQAVEPLEFVCEGEGGERRCFLLEIDRGSAGSSLEERFVSGSKFIQFLYDHGVRCERETPCP